MNEKIDVNVSTTTYLGGSDSGVKVALYAAVEKNNVEIVKLLLANEKIDVNFSNHHINNIIGWKKTALYTAVKNENIDIVKLLLSNKNIDVNILNRENCFGETLSERTALHAAVESGNKEIINLLSEMNGKDINIENDKKKVLDGSKIDGANNCIIY